MKVRYKLNGAVIVVDPEFGKRLVAKGTWEEVEPPKPAPRKRATKKAAPKEEPSTEE